MREPEIEFKIAKADSSNKVTAATTESTTPMTISTSTATVPAALTVATTDNELMN